MYRRYIKRILDILLSLIGLIVLSPLLLVVTVWLHFANKGAGAFFTQIRPGLHERIFKIYKFKSMTDERDEQGNLLPDGKRLTSAGRFIRKTSLDELPQLWNVLRGDMSLVGPRPLLTAYLPYYTEQEHRRHSVRPGITGLAQVRGRSHLPWNQKLATDVEYTQQLSFALDCRIVWKTFVNVLSSKDVAVDPSLRGIRLDVERAKRITE